MWYNLFGNFKPKSGNSLVFVVVYCLVIFILNVNLCHSEYVKSNALLPTTTLINGTISVKSTTNINSIRLPTESAEPPIPTTTRTTTTTIATPITATESVSTAHSIVTTAASVPIGFEERPTKQSSILNRLSTIRSIVTTNNVQNSTNAWLNVQRASTSTTLNTEKVDSSNRNTVKSRIKQKQTTSLSQQQQQQQQQQPQYKVSSWPSKTSGTYLTEDKLQRFDPVPCNERQFKCGDGKCIPVSFACDGDIDCSDGLDENPKECMITKDKPCDADKFKCQNGRCILRRWLCDRENDCSDGSDENPEVCKKHVCTPEEFTCKSSDGECIPMGWVCDQNRDCSDGSDEANCNQTCRSDEFTCANGHCIQNRWRCDADDDCGDNSDEQNCSKTKCKEDDFMCSDGTCIVQKWRCDGDPDCGDASDEFNCTNTKVLQISVCPATDYLCKDRITCIDRQWLCDGGNDCPHGDDESPEHCQNKTCREDQFQCNNLKCIPGHLMCSGKAECEDGSDEVNCTLPTRKCDRATEFDCGGGMCIPLTKVCDLKVDCPGGQDEPKDKCTINECKIANGGCDHICVDTPAAFYCDCRKGFELQGNTTCVDIDECKIPGTCSQFCTNEIGAYKCECGKGYMRDSRHHNKCKAIEGHASLLFARRHDIRKISLDHNEMTSIVNDTKSATALDYVFRTGMIYWSDVAEQRIYKAPIDEGNKRTAVVKDSKITADGLAVDWIYDHIYYSDTKRCVIDVTNFDGTMTKELIKDDLEIPRALALDPVHGFMYWTDWGSSPRIERAGMDGTHRQTIVSNNIKWANGLTLDLVLNRIYWVDAKLNIISSCNFDGSDRRVILYSAEYLRHPFSITTFEDYVYWTDWDKAAVFKANKFTGEDIQPITAMRMLQHPMTIHVYHPYRQPDGINHCQAVNGHCSHLCLPAPQILAHGPKISCACPTGLKLLEDEQTCIEDAESKPAQGNNQSNTEQASPHPTNGDSGTVALIAIAILTTILVIASVILLWVYRYYIQHRTLTSMNFDNPVYRKTTEDQFSLEKNLATRVYPSSIEDEMHEPLNKEPINEFL